MNSKVKNKNRKYHAASLPSYRVADIFWNKGLLGFMHEQLNAEQEQNKYNLKKKKKEKE